MSKKRVERRMAVHVLNILSSSKRTRAEVWKGEEDGDETGWVFACHDYTGTTWMRWKTRRHLVFHSCLQQLGFCSLYMHTHTRWQSTAGACGSSPVTAARSQGGNASGAAPRIGEPCLCWPRINNFSFSAEMTGIVIKEMEWFYWPWCLY